MKTKKIAIQGLRGSFHHEAAGYVFGDDILLNECVTFKEVTDSVLKGASDYGVMAIENSLAGCMVPNYNLLRHSGLQVGGEVGIRVRLNLLSLHEGTQDSLVEVRSHPMALRQCGTYLETLNGARIVEAFDTAGSAKEIADQKLSGVAAVAGDLAAKEYGLNVMAAGIEDNKLNYTRFLVLKRKGQKPIKEEVDKLSLYFQTKHAPGSLAQLLAVISGLGINVSKLQSHPIPSKNTLYGFFATLEIEHARQIDHLKTLLDAMTIDHQLLGAYKKGETHG